MRYLPLLTLTTPLTTALSLQAALSTTPELSTFATLLEDFNIAESIKLPSPFPTLTILAPSNDAYTDAAAAGFDMANTCPMHMTNILKYSFVDGDFPTDANSTTAYTAMTGLNTTSHTPVRLFTQDGAKFVESGLGVPIRVVGEAVEFDEGRVYILESMLVTPHGFQASVQGAGVGGFGEVAARYGVQETFGNLHDATVFVPAGEMGEGGCPMVLLNHVVLGRVLFSDVVGEEERVYRTMAGGEVSVMKMPCGCLIVNGQHVVQQDVIWSGGVIHVLEEPLMPRRGLSPTTTLKFRFSLLSKFVGSAAHALEVACLAALAMALVALVQLYRYIRQLEAILHERSTVHFSEGGDDEKVALLYRDAETEQDEDFGA